MLTRNESRIRLSHLVIAAIIAASLVIQLILLFNAGQDANTGEFSGDSPVWERLWRLFSFFTIQSNLIVLAVSIGLIRNPDRDGPFWRVLRLDSLLGIVITGLVFAIVLAPELHLTGWALVATIGFHYLSPWLTLLAWLLFGPRPRFTWAAVGWAFVWPLAWLGYTLIVGAIDNWYPYPFLNAHELGYGTALRNCFLVLVLGVILAGLFKLLDAKLPRR